MKISEILIELLSGYMINRYAVVACEDVDMYTGTGITAYVIANDFMPYDVSKFKRLSLKLTPLDTEIDVRITLTGDARIIGQSEYAHCYASTGTLKDKSVMKWINPTSLSGFDDPMLFARANEDRILVYEHPPNCNDMQLVGVVLPVKIKFE